MGTAEEANTTCHQNMPPKILKSSFGFIPVRDAVNELRRLTFYRDLLVEALVTFFLVFMCVIGSTPLQGRVPPMLSIGLVAGFYVFVLLEAFAHLQFAAMNPVAALAFVCTKRISFIKGIVYVPVQLVGGTAGAALAMACVPPSVRELIKPFAPGVGVSEPQALIIEIVIAGILCFVILGCLDEDRRKLTVPALAMGTAVAMGVTAAGPYSGGGLNPSVAFSLAAVTGNWNHQWVYWAGDMAGAVLATSMYAFFVYDKGLFAPAAAVCAGDANRKNNVATTYSVKDGDDEPGSSAFVKMSPEDESRSRNGRADSTDEVHPAV